MLTPQAIAKAQPSVLERCTRSSGCYRQKAKKLKILAKEFLRNADFDRPRLLALWGVGPETADTILLYGFHQPTFVVDAYTRRLLVHLTNDRRWLARPYEDVRALFESVLPRSVEGYQEAHALIVKWGKETRLPSTGPRHKMR